MKISLGLGHSFSRSKVNTDIKRQDKHIINAISLLEQIDKNLNLFSMRVKEWYSWHFPELAKIVSDNRTFVQLVLLIQVLYTKNPFNIYLLFRTELKLINLILLLKSKKLSQTHLLLKESSQLLTALWVKTLLKVTW